MVSELDKIALEVGLQAFGVWSDDEIYWKGIILDIFTCF